MKCICISFFCVQRSLKKHFQNEYQFFELLLLLAPDPDADAAAPVFIGTDSNFRYFLRELATASLYNTGSNLVEDLSKGM